MYGFDLLSIEVKHILNEEKRKKSLAHRHRIVHEILVKSKKEYIHRKWIIFVAGNRLVRAKNINKTSQKKHEQTNEYVQNK